MYICAKIAGASLMKMNHNRKTINRIITGDSEYFCIICFLFFFFCISLLISNRLIWSVVASKICARCFFFCFFSYILHSVSGAIHASCQPDNPINILMYVSELFMPLFCFMFIFKTGRQNIDSKIWSAYAMMVVFHTKIRDSRKIDWSIYNGL